MLLLRLLVVLTLIAITGGVFAYLLTQNRMYLSFAWRLFRYSLIVALLTFALMIIERVLVIPV
jgi:hypothetical protein